MLSDQTQKIFARFLIGVLKSINSKCDPQVDVDGINMAYHID